MRSVMVQPRHPLTRLLNIVWSLIEGLSLPLVLSYQLEPRMRREEKLKVLNRGWGPVPAGLSVCTRSMLVVKEPL